MRSVVLLLLLSVAAYGQGPLEPIRVSVTGDDEELSSYFRKELRKRRDIIAATRDADVEIHLSALKLSEEDVCAGFVVAVLVVDRKSGRLKLTIDTGPSLRGMAERAVAKMKLQR